MRDRCTKKNASTRTISASTCSFVSEFEHVLDLLPVPGFQYRQGYAALRSSKLDAFQRCQTHQVIWVQKNGDSGQVGHCCDQQVHLLRQDIGHRAGQARDVAAWACQAGHQALANRIDRIPHDDGNFGVDPPHRIGGERHARDNEVNIQLCKLRRDASETFIFSVRKAPFDGEILSFDIAQIHAYPVGNRHKDSLRLNPDASPATKPIRRTRSGCCARTTIGHAAAPPSPAMNSRRRVHPSRSGAGRLALFQLSGSRTSTRFPSHFTAN